MIVNFSALPQKASGEAPTATPDKDRGSLGEFSLQINRFMSAQESTDLEMRNVRKDMPGEEGAGEPAHSIESIFCSGTNDSDKATGSGIGPFQSPAMRDFIEYLRTPSSGSASEKEQPEAQDIVEKADTLHGDGASSQTDRTDGMNSSVSESAEMSVPALDESRTHQEMVNNSAHRNSEDRPENASATDRGYSGVEISGAVLQNSTAESAPGSGAREHTGGERLETGWAHAPKSGDRSAVNVTSVPGIQSDRPLQETGPIVTRAADHYIKEQQPAGERSAGQVPPVVQEATDARDTPAAANLRNEASAAFLSRGMADNAGTGGGFSRQSSHEGQGAFSTFASGTAHASGSIASAGPSNGQISTAHPGEFLLQVAQRIQLSATARGEELRIQLKPDNLGRLEIRALATDAGINARIVTESREVKGFLENNIAMIRQSLQDQGLKVDRISIFIQTDVDGQADSGSNAKSGHTGSGHRDVEHRRDSSATPAPATQTIDEAAAAESIARIRLNPAIRFHTIA